MGATALFVYVGRRVRGGRMTGTGRPQVSSMRASGVTFALTPIRRGGPRCEGRRMAGMDWDRERRNRPGRERGSDRMDDAGAPRRPCTRAPKEQVEAEIARLLKKFTSLPSRGDQLGYLTTVNKTLYRLLCDHEAVKQVVKKRFKPRLKPL